MRRNLTFGDGFAVGTLASTASAALFHLAEAHRAVALPVLRWLIAVLSVGLVVTFVYGTLRRRGRGRRRS